MQESDEQPVKSLLFSVWQGYSLTYSSPVHLFVSIRIVPAENGLITLAAPSWGESNILF